MARKPSQHSADAEALLQKALDGIANGTYTSAYQAAKQLDVPRSTIYKRLQNHKSRSQARENQQLLSNTEEKALAQWVKQLTATGYPAQHSIVHEMAEEIRNQRVVGVNDASMELVSYRPIGQQWVQRFLLRHPQLQSVIGVRIEASRLHNITKEILNRWLNAFAVAFEEHHITMENSYNMDETGNGMGMVAATRVIVDSSVGSRVQAEPGRQEWITAIECICADGTSIPPLIIFAGENLIHNWVPTTMPENWKFTCNTKGWTNNVLGLEWLQRCLNLQLEKKQMNESVCSFAMATTVISQQASLHIACRTISPFSFYLLIHLTLLNLSTLLSLVH